MSGEKEPNETEEEKKLTKLGKLTNTEVLREEKQKSTKLVSLCGRRFDTVEVLRHHTANCKECQAIQDKEAAEERKEQAKAGGEQ